MNLKWIGKKVVYAILAIFLCLFVLGTFDSAHSIGSGIAFNDYMQRNAYTFEDWDSQNESTKTNVRRAASRQGSSYATFIALVSLFVGLNAIVSVAYTLRERFFTRLRTTIVALTLSGLAGASSAIANTHLGYSSSDSIPGGVGIGIVVFVAFYLLTGVLALGRRAASSFFELSEHEANILDSDSKLARTEVNVDPDRPNWWRRQNATFRKWAFGSTLWVVFVFFIVVLFEPFTNKYDIDDDEYVARMVFVMTIPLLAAGIRYIYNKFVK